MCEIIKCFQCGDKLLNGDEYRKVDEGVVCSISCNNEYLMIDQPITGLDDE